MLEGNLRNQPSYRNGPGYEEDYSLQMGQTLQNVTQGRWIRWMLIQGQRVIVLESKRPTKRPLGGIHKHSKVFLSQTKSLLIVMR